MLLQDDLVVLRNGVHVDLLPRLRIHVKFTHVADLTRWVQVSRLLLFFSELGQSHHFKLVQTFKARWVKHFFHIRVLAVG